MEMPSADTPAPAYLPKSAYTTARVAADTKKAAGLEPGLETAHVRLKKALRDSEDLEELIEKKTAILDNADAGCDEDVEVYELALYGLADKNRNDRRYRRYFRHGLREVTQADARKDEPEMVKQMLDAMEEDKNDPDLGPLVAVWSPKLTASRAKVVAADEVLSTLEKEHTFLTETTIPSLMAAWREEYKKLHGALTTVYPDNPKKVERFFKPFRKRRKDQKKPEASPPPAPPAT